MKLNPVAVVFWVTCGLGGYLFSGGNPIVAAWSVFGAMAFSTLIMLLPDRKRRRF